MRRHGFSAGGDLMTWAELNKDQKKQVAATLKLGRDGALRVDWDEFWEIKKDDIRKMAKNSRV